MYDSILFYNFEVIKSELMIFFVSSVLRITFHSSAFTAV